MVLAERCALLSAEILKSQAKYSEAATLLIKMTSEVRMYALDLSATGQRDLLHSVITVLVQQVMRAG